MLKLEKMVSNMLEEKQKHDIEDLVWPDVFVDNRKREWNSPEWFRLIWKLKENNLKVMILCFQVWFCTKMQEGI